MYISVTRYMRPDLSRTGSHAAAYHCDLVIRKHRNITDLSAFALDADQIIDTVPPFQLCALHLLQLLMVAQTGSAAEINQILVVLLRKVRI